MRSKEHIKQVLSDLEKVWTNCPELRLCQLVCNALEEAGYGESDPFYVEDYEFQNGLKELIRLDKKQEEFNKTLRGGR